MGVGFVIPILTFCSSILESSDLKDLWYDSDFINEEGFLLVIITVLLSYVLLSFFSGYGYTLHK